MAMMIGGLSEIWWFRCHVNASEILGARLKINDNFFDSDSFLVNVPPRPEFWSKMLKLALINT